MDWVYIKQPVHTSQPYILWNIPDWRRWIKENKRMNIQAYTKSMKQSQNLTISMSLDGPNCIRITGQLWNGHLRHLDWKYKDYIFVHYLKCFKKVINIIRQCNKFSLLWHLWQSYRRLKRCVQFDFTGGEKYYHWCIAPITGAAGRFSLGYFTDYIYFQWRCIRVINKHVFLLHSMGNTARELYGEHRWELYGQYCRELYGQY